MKITNQQQWILNYLKDMDDFVSPTEIGGQYSKNHHSSWASPKCLKLVKMGLLERNNNGHYRIVNKQPHTN